MSYGIDINMISIYGIYMDMRDLCLVFGFSKENGIDYEDTWEMVDFLRDFFDSIDPCLYNMTNLQNSTIYIGYEWRTIGINETGGQFMERVQRDISLVIPAGTPLHFGTWEDSWID